MRDWLPVQIRGNSLIALSFTQEHALAAAELPRHHEDPFDRMLIAQDHIEDLRIITADAQFERYDVRLIDATYYDSRLLIFGRFSDYAVCSWTY